MPVINIIDNKCIVEWFLSLFKKKKKNSASIYVGEVIQSFCDFMQNHVEN